MLQKMWREKIYKNGGAHTIAAFAYGTKNFEKVDKIVGPGMICRDCKKRSFW